MYKSFLHHKVKLYISGSCNPFCTFYIRSKPREYYNTSCKAKSLNPKWSESFSISLEKQELEDNDILHVDVWTFNDKFKSKLNPKSLKQLVKGGNENQSSQHKLIGSVEVPLKKVPASGFNKFWQIEKLTSPDQKVRLNVLI